MLRVLQAGDWLTVGIIVVRYFGGVKLGTGGITRAYSSAAKAAPAHMAGISFEHHASTAVEVPFNAQNGVERLIKESELAINSREYNANGVRICIVGSGSGGTALCRGLSRDQSWVARARRTPVEFESTSWCA